MTFRVLAFSWIPYDFFLQVNELQLINWACISFKDSCLDFSIYFSSATCTLSSYSTFPSLPHSSWHRAWRRKRLNITFVLRIELNFSSCRARSTVSWTHDTQSILYYKMHDKHFIHSTYTGVVYLEHCIGATESLVFWEKREKSAAQKPHSGRNSLIQSASICDKSIWIMRHWFGPSSVLLFKRTCRKKNQQLYHIRQMLYSVSAMSASQPKNCLISLCAIPIVWFWIEHCCCYSFMCRYL